MVTSFQHYDDVSNGATYGQRAADLRLFVFYLSHGLVRVCEMELSHLGKSNQSLRFILSLRLYSSFIT